MALVFLGVSSAGLLNAVGYSNARLAIAKRRAVIFEEIKARIEIAKAQTTGGTISTGSSFVTVNGVVVTIQTVTVSVSGMTQVKVTATWNEPTFSSTRSDTMIVRCYVKPNET